MNGIGWLLKDLLQDVFVYIDKLLHDKQEVRCWVLFLPLHSYELR